MDQGIKISLAAVRVNTGMSQTEWARLIGVSNNTVSHWEKGYTVPNAMQLRKMSELSGIPIGNIFLSDKNENSVSVEKSGA